MSEDVKQRATPEVMAQLEEMLYKVAGEDVEGLLVGEVEYDRSWIAHDGVGAFFTLIRGLHRLEAICKTKPKEGDRYDIFQHVLESPPNSGALDAMRDIRRYLLNVEAELTRRGHKLPRQRHNIIAGENKKKLDMKEWNKIEYPKADYLEGLTTAKLTPLSPAEIMAAVFCVRCLGVGWVKSTTVENVESTPSSEIIKCTACSGTGSGNAGSGSKK